MSESNLDKNAQPASSTPASPDELIRDLDLTLTEAEQKGVVGGKGEHIYMDIKMKEVIVTAPK